MKKIIISLLILVGMFSVIGLYNVTHADTVSDYLNESSWVNLPGYEYITSNVKADGDAKYPAEVTFGKNANDIGINLKLKGYYQSGYGDEQGNGFSGIVYKNKIPLDGFSVTFTCNKLGASSNASPADDGWVGIGFMSKCNMFSTLSTNVNMGAVALVRASNRGCIVYLHEIASDGNGYKISNFAKGTQVSVELTTTPSFEGSTIRVSFVKVVEPTINKFYLKVEQIDFESGEVLASKTSSNPFEAPNIYMDKDGKGYLTISASTDNFDKSWDLSIKNICGENIGLKADEAPISATERAESIYQLIEKLDIYSNFDLEGTLSNEGKEFYTQNNTININDLVTSLSVGLFNADDETINKLVEMDAVSSEFNTNNEYIAFVNKCNDVIIENYETDRINTIISKINNIVSSLPNVENVSLSNEQKVASDIHLLQVYHNELNSKAIEIYGQENYDALWDKIVTYSDKLSDVSIAKYDLLISELPSTVTVDNLKQTILDLVSCELIYEKLEEELETIEVNNNSGYQKLVAGKLVQDRVRSEVEGLRSANKRVVENFEKAGKVIYSIYYLPAEVLADDFDSIQALVTSYNQLSNETKEFVTEKRKLISCAVSVLDLAIKQAPDYTSITQDNYLANNYDTLINKFVNLYNSIESADEDALSSIQYTEKFNKLKGKLESIVSPLSTNVVSKITLNGSEVKEITFAEMFNNYLGKNFEVTSNYGTVDSLGEILSINFTSNGEYTVEVTIKDKDYDQTAKCEFTVEVKGFEEKKSGCGSTVGGSIALLSLGALLIIKKKNK